MNWQLINTLPFNWLDIIFWAIIFFVGYKGKGWLWAVGLWTLDLIMQFVVNPAGLIAFALLIALLGWEGILLIVGFTALSLAIAIFVWWIGKKVGEK